MTETLQDPTAVRRPRWLVALWVVAALLWLTPAVAMRFTREVVWGPLDFTVFGAMLTAACGTCELAVRRSGTWSYRLATVLAVAAAFLMTWINLAVGIVGDPGNPANLAFAGVLLVAILGAALGRFQPQGMAWALLATAAAQALIAIAALVARWWPAFLLSAVFTGVWLLSAQLYRRAALGTGSGEPAR